jgi:hypothetical protein
MARLTGMRRTSLARALLSLALLTLATGLTLATSAMAQTPSYFPARAFGPPRVHDLVVRWYSSHLRAMGEPSLLAMRGRDRHVVRFLKLPTWGPPEAIRVERRGDTVTLVHRVLSGQGGYDPGHLATDQTRTLTRADWARLEQAIASADGWTAPTRTDFRGRDGEQWVVELVDGDRYHVLDRWTPTEDASAARFVALCALLSRLAP